MQKNDQLLVLLFLRYFFTNSGYFCTASDIEQKIIPFSVSLSLKVVATETESKTASTAILFNLFVLAKEFQVFYKFLKVLDQVHQDFLVFFKSFWC